MHGPNLLVPINQTIIDKETNEDAKLGMQISLKEPN